MIDRNYKCFFMNILISVIPCLTFAVQYQVRVIDSETRMPLQGVKIRGWFSNENGKPGVFFVFLGNGLPLYKKLRHYISILTPITTTRLVCLDAFRHHTILQLPTRSHKNKATLQPME